MLTGAADRDAARALAAHAGEVVVTLGAEGALWSDGRTVEHVPAAPAVAVDTTGAGDAFAAGFLAARPRARAPAGARGGRRAGGGRGGAAGRAVGVPELAGERRGGRLAHPARARRRLRTTACASACSPSPRRAARR